MAKMWLRNPNEYPYPMMSCTMPLNPSSVCAFEPLKPKNCPNCGAPVRGSECEYCGTIFERTISYEEYNIEVNFAHDGDAVARSMRRFNPATGTYEWVAESKNKSVSGV